MNVFPIDFLQKICYEHNSAFIFDRIFIKLVGNQDRHKLTDR